MYFVKTPGLVKPLIQDLVWSYPTEEKVLYLTFDDGPTPEVTPWVLDELDRYGARATFFCVGRQVAAHEALFRLVLSRGHAIGNHTFDHMNGWKTAQKDYLENVARCAEVVPSSLFRPPYGKISRGQARALKTAYRIIMWDVLSADFDTRVQPVQCARNVIDHAGPGSIVVFHDSRKAETNLRQALPMVLDHFSQAGYRFESIPD